MVFAHDNRGLLENFIANCILSFKNPIFHSTFWVTAWKFLEWNQNPRPQNISWNDYDKLFQHNSDVVMANIVRLRPRPQPPRTFEAKAIGLEAKASICTSRAEKIRSRCNNVTR